LFCKSRREFARRPEAIFHDGRDLKKQYSILRRRAESGGNIILPRLQKHALR